MEIEPYPAIAIQKNLKSVNAKDPIDKIKKFLKAEIETICSLIDRGASYERTENAGALFVLPECMLKGFPREPVKEALKTCIRIPGEETDRLAEKAIEHDAHICGNEWEVMDDWPNRIWNTAFIIDPRGKVILKQRKMQQMPYTVPVTNPHDVYDEYVKKYGDNFFPVVDTKIGKLGAYICADRIYPEPARCLALQGCEVLCNPTGTPDPWATDPIGTMELCNRWHAMANLAYVVCANIGWGQFENGRVSNMSCGRSMVVDFDGRIMMQAHGSGESVIGGYINLEALRHRRSLMTRNMLTTLRTEVYKPFYNKTVYPPNQWSGKPFANIQQQRDICKKQIEEAFKTGKYKGKYFPSRRARNVF